MRNNNDGERLARLETDISYIKQSLEEIQSVLAQRTEDARKDAEMIIQLAQNLRTENEVRYASKWTEKVIYGLVGIICLAVISQLLKLVVK